MKRLLISCLAVILLPGCSSSLDQDQYVRWVESYEHGLRVRTTVNDYVLDVQYKPTDYVALQRMNYDDVTQDFDVARSAAEKLQYYTLTISTNQSENDLLRHGNLAEKQRLLYYFSYELQHAIRLVENGEQLPCVLYHFERSYDLKSTQTLVLGFERPVANPEQATLVIAPPLFSPQTISITLDKRNIPTLQL